MEVLMKKLAKNLIAASLALTLTISPELTTFASNTEAAKPSHTNTTASTGIILSSNAFTLTENSSTTLVAAIQEGLDASKLNCISSNPAVATIKPVISVNHIANFEVSYTGNGSAVIAIYHSDNPAIVAYANVNSTSVIMDLPSKLGTNSKNYCKVTGYEFLPYKMNQYSNFNDYKYTLKLNYECSSYKDDAYTKWGCYGYFYDAAGNILSKVHLYCNSLTEGRTYHSEFNVPVNAVRFTVEGKN